MNKPSIPRLEASVDHIQGDVSELRADMKETRERLVRLETKVDHLPSKGFIVGATLSTLAVMAALVAFAEKLQSLVG